MGITGDVASAAPTRRTADQEQIDRDTVIRNFTTGAYLDWPNEAGFQDLHEHRGPIKLTVKGTIPAWASGSFYRNGPGSRKIEGAKSRRGQVEDGTVHISHWFDGLAHLHRFDITISDDGQVEVFYSSRRQADNFVKLVQEKGSYGDVTSFAQKADPCIGIFGKAMICVRALDQGKEALRYDNMNVTVLPGIDLPNTTPSSSFSPSSPSSSSKAIHGIGSNGKKVDNVDKTGGQLAGTPAATATGHRQGGNKTVWICSDTSGLRIVDAATLEPIGSAVRQSELHPLLKGALSCAHAQRDPMTGDLFNYNIQGGRYATYRVFRVSAATGKTDILATISRHDLAPAYIHSFFLSERFVILKVPSSHYGTMGLSVLWKRNLVDAMEPFDESKVCKWYVIDRLHGKGVIAEFDTPAGFFFHTVNCWDKIVAQEDKDKTSGTEKGTGSEIREEADVFCDLVEFPNLDILQVFYHDILLNIDNQAQKRYGDETTVAKTMSSLVRWKFRVALPTASPKDSKVFSIPAPHTGEMPTINTRYLTKPYQYVYSLLQNGKSTFLDTIVKTDTVTREAVSWSSPNGHTPSEAIFVPRPGSEKEDDGVLLSVVLDGYSEKSYLICLDAGTMMEVGRAEMDFSVAFGLHGLHCPT
ncbi:hypothetical protein M406DRAFT_343619 [Cryphonectria parasitica EP155]|uniref:Carotenoid cleavage dioxygenase 1 n=1 Tax=Cryphonectria parasitica (strain ATCC 38755 / EP155) TaxID=660469 RepID=A0A9P5CJR4_CRYP1|nr:uncharacterized protein M406DRAFT_343619 [Cryphonectria parasitica EP155]KAF3759995.1 hypothetical protein M406DRAFT_343619 [Cryphonectria parasitica EP155]